MCIDCKYYQDKCTNQNDCANKKELEQIRADAIDEYKDALLKYNVIDKSVVKRCDCNYKQ